MVPCRVWRDGAMQGIAGWCHAGYGGMVPCRVWRGTPNPAAPILTPAPTPGVLAPTLGSNHILTLNHISALPCLYLVLLVLNLALALALTRRTPEVFLALDRRQFTLERPASTPRKGEGYGYSMGKGYDAGKELPSGPAL